jgi:hypothetical protein
MWTGFPALGVGAGWALHRAVDWLVTLPWIPFRGPVRLLAGLPEPTTTIGAFAIGALAGLLFAGLVATDLRTVTISPQRIALTHGRSTREVDRASVTAAFLDGRHLVLLGPATEELVREVYDLGADRLRNALLAHGYPWHDGDPFRDGYQRWADDAPDLPGGANTLFRARERALRSGDRDDAAELRDALAKLGVVVREERHHQFWRPPGRATQRCRAPRSRNVLSSISAVSAGGSASMHSRSMAAA